MSGLLTYTPILVTSFAVLMAAVIGWAVYSLLWDRRNRYASSRFQEVGEIEDTIERLEQKKSSLDETINQLKDELAHIDEKRGQLDQINAELTDKERRLLATENALDQANKAKTEYALAQEETERIRAEKASLTKEVEALESRRTEAAESAKNSEQQLQTAKAQLEQTIATLTTLQTQTLAAQSELKSCQNQLESFRSQEETARKTAQEAVQQSNEATQRLKNLESEIRKLEHDKTRLDKVEPELAANEKKLRESEHTLSDLAKDIDRSRNELERIQKTISSRESERKQAEALRKEVSELREDKNHLVEQRSEQEIALQKISAEVLRLKGTLGQDEKQDPAEDLKIEPREVFESAKVAKPCTDTELNMLTDFRNKLKEAGYIFSTRTIYSFHTALKCQHINPLTVLAGVSGTGKTLLPIQYAKYFGIMQLVVSVQPRWDSPQDLFGFYNYLERKYKATDLSRLLWSYNYRNTYKDRMSIVLFDEMNLARTEYYFSDFLSKLELRRLESNNANIQLEIPQARASLPIPSNMLMVGTMNEDESTQTLSDKVLDRANVLRFGRPLRNSDQPRKTENLTFCGNSVTKQVWDSWHSEDHFSSEAISKVSEWIEELNDALELLGRPFGYRVKEAMISYVRQYPDHGMKAYRLSFADQIEQKILPKMRGVDTNNQNYVRAITKIQNVIAQTEDNILINAFSEADKEGRIQGLFVWNGVSRT